MDIRLTLDKAQEMQSSEGMSRVARRLQESELDLEALRQAAQEFEAIFLQHLLSTMRKAVPKSELLPGSMATDIFEDMFDEEIAKISASAGGIGLAEMLLAQLAEQAYNPR